MVLNNYVIVTDATKTGLDSKNIKRN